MTNAQNQFYNHKLIKVIPQQYIDEARAFLANAQDNQLLEIIAESFYRDDLGGVE